MNLDFNGRTVLVVGGAGYVGSVLTSRLLDAGARVRVLDQLIYDNGFSLQHLLDRERITFLRGDLRDPEVFARAASGADDVALLASLVGDPVCKKYPELARQVNADGARRIIDDLDALGVQRFVFTSTCSNYGIHDPASFAREDSELNPQSRYAQTKIEVEQYLLERATRMQTSSTVLRIATAYGLSPRMRFDLTVSQFAWELASGAELLVYDAETWRPYCHVRDIAKAIMTALMAPPEMVRAEVFNVGDNTQQFTKRMIVEEVQKHVTSTKVTYRDGDTDPRNYRVSFDKISDRLGFQMDHRVPDYIGALTAAVQAGVFPDVRGNPRYGNYEVRHLG
ncbi:NAD-dependent epimerase/dehydratase family protein [Pseudonocardia asaccharolytica]|uniref:Epimerase n=1 Tax=Pseudonocardia asaccharolytica DSM 44247 = NBRC 16224 TaxID=1123024 RepID=A0A511CWP3_9PSEU|nr:NAD(P)-dependent oxidoreductase [Pseudonocardia asaccharolytica]GEL16897.1 epimerase [Pseudonocardia asaccharolytica DSM 44247 = NBRC 16224]